MLSVDYRLDAIVLACVQANPVFLDKVTTWQRKLGTVDLVLGTWADLQKKWQALVSIFPGSADIREQLPEDSARFDVVNVDFKVSNTTVSSCSGENLISLIH